MVGTFRSHHRCDRSRATAQRMESQQEGRVDTRRVGLVEASRKAERRPTDTVILRCAPLRASKDDRPRWCGNGSGRAGADALRGRRKRAGASGRRFRGRRLRGAQHLWCSLGRDALGSGRALSACRRNARREHASDVHRLAAGAVADLMAARSAVGDDEAPAMPQQLVSMVSTARSGTSFSTLSTLPSAPKAF